MKRCRWSKKSYFSDACLTYRRCNLLATVVLLALFVSCLCVPSVVLAQGEHSRRAGAELLVLKGDLLSITNPSLSNKHKKGLHDRIKGGLAALEILLRYADQERGRSVASQFVAVNNIYEAVDNKDFSSATAILDQLIKRYPLILPSIRVSEPLKFLSLHEKLCSACHDKPATDVERPAYNLYEQTQSVSQVEMFARLLTGVRGDRVTGIDNPLSDIQLMGLLALYSTH